MSDRDHEDEELDIYTLEEKFGLLACVPKGTGGDRDLERIVEKAVALREQMDSLKVELDMARSVETAHYKPEVWRLLGHCRDGIDQMDAIFRFS